MRSIFTAFEATQPHLSTVSMLAGLQKQGGRLQGGCGVPSTVTSQLETIARKEHVSGHLLCPFYQDLGVVSFLLSPVSLLLAL